MVTHIFLDHYLLSKNIRLASLLLLIPIHSLVNFISRFCSSNVFCCVTFTLLYPITKL